MSTDGSSKLSYARAVQLLRYEADTGLIFWRDFPNHGKRKGVAGWAATGGYVRIKVDYAEYAAHRVAWLLHYGAWPERCLDHINGIRDDNRIANLRDISLSANNQNLRKAKITNKSSGLLGAYPTRGSRRWRSQIRHAGRIINLGVFDNATAAHDAYVNMKRRLHEGCTL